MAPTIEREERKRLSSQGEWPWAVRLGGRWIGGDRYANDRTIEYTLQQKVR
jgi:hypothetical protein